MSRYLSIPVVVECQNDDCRRILTLHVARTKHVSDLEDVWRHAENQADELGWKIDYNTSLCPSRNDVEGRLRERYSEIHNEGFVECARIFEPKLKKAEEALNDIVAWTKEIPEAKDKMKQAIESIYAIAKKGLEAR